MTPAEQIEQQKQRLAALAAEFKAISAAKTPAPTGNVIKASVGEGGKNDAADVTIVQKLLNSKYKLGVSEDGKIGPKTIAAIKQFQLKVVKLANPDGRIDPGGKSWQALSAGAAPSAENPAPTTPTVTPTSGMITASVGEGGKNVAADVAAVQTLFNKNHGTKFAVDGKAGAQLIAAIRALQTAGGSSKPDGCIDPNGKTWGLLNKSSVAPVNNTTNPPVDPVNNNPVVPGLVPTKGMITGSVGKGGVNNPADVAAVQILLNTNYDHKFSINGICDAKLINAIAAAQSDNGSKSPDGRVDPNGATWGFLQKEAPKFEPPQGMEKPSWIRVAEGEKGVMEIPGKAHNPRVIEYHSTTGKFPDDETPWCASFVTWVMQKAGVDGGFKSAGAVNWKNFGQQSLVNKKPAAAYGAIAVFSYGGGKGHVGFVVGKSGKNILVLGGNQGNMVKVSAFAESAPVAYVFPSGYTIPAAAYTFGDNGGDIAEADFNSTR